MLRYSIRKNEKWLIEYIEGLKNLMGDRLSLIILYGSYARGDWDEESDVDILIVIDDDINNLQLYKQKIVRLESEIILRYGVLISSIITLKSTYTSKVNFIPLYININKEGKLLYG
ncbi:nucleotidyltransferase domain-containing protein [Caldicellulosiruptoraceae bacterium PP1]